MSQEKDSRSENTFSRLDSHFLVAKIEKSANRSNLTSDDVDQLNEELKEADRLFAQKVQLDDCEEYDFSNEDTIRMYAHLESDGLAPKYVRLNYVRENYFTLSVAGHFKGVCLEDGELAYVVESQDEKGDVNRITSAVKGAKLTFEADKSFEKICECINLLRDGVGGESASVARDILNLLDAYARNELDDYLPILRDKLRTLLAKDFTLSEQYALETILFIVCFGHSSDHEVKSRGLLVTDKQSGRWDYRENKREPMTKRGEAVAIILEPVEERFIAQLYMREIGTDDIIRIPLDLIESTSVLPLNNDE